MKYRDQSEFNSPVHDKLARVGSFIGARLSEVAIGTLAAVGVAGVGTAALTAFDRHNGAAAFAASDSAAQDIANRLVPACTVAPGTSDGRTLDLVLRFTRDTATAAAARNHAGLQVDLSAMGVLAWEDSNDLAHAVPQIDTTAVTQSELDATMQLSRIASGEPVIADISLRVDTITPDGAVAGAVVDCGSIANNADGSWSSVVSD